MLATEFIRKEQNRLLAERSQLLEEEAHLRTSIQAEIELDDFNSDILGKELDSALLTHLQHKLRDIEAALRAIASGEYGLCQRCGIPIDVERLEARPDAPFCLHCQEEIERISHHRAHYERFELHSNVA